MRRAAMLMTAAALGLAVQLGEPVSASSVAAEAEPTVVTGWWSPTAVTVQPGGVVSVPVRVKTGTQYVARQVQVQRRRGFTAAWVAMTSGWTTLDGRYTAHMFAPAGTWQFRLVVPATATGLAAETGPRTVTVLRAETISAGHEHTCALDTTGKAWCWGRDQYGQLGNGGASQADRFRPGAVVGGRTFATISAGYWHTCALDTSGKAWCWGWDFWGPVGDGAANRTPKYAPVAVAGGHTFATVSADWHTCALDTTAKAWCWGPDGYGQVGDGAADQTPKHVPAAVSGGQTFRTIATGYRHSCGTDTTGKAWCWGADEYGQLGDGNDNEADEYAPVPVSGARAFSTGTAGERHTCAVDGSGSAWCWGWDEYGQLGNGNGGAQNRYAPAAVAGSHTFLTLTAGRFHTCGLDTGARAWCWGNDPNGQVGDGGEGFDPPRTVPTAVSGNHSFKTGSAGGYHTCALDTGGKAWCWGSNATGQVGVGTQQELYVPTTVAGGHIFRLPN